MYLGCHIGPSLQRPKQVSSETPIKVSVVHQQDFSLVRLHDVMVECCHDVLRKRNYDVTLAYPRNVSNKS